MNKKRLQYFSAHFLNSLGESCHANHWADHESKALRWRQGKLTFSISLLVFVLYVPLASPSHSSHIIVWNEWAPDKFLKLVGFVYHYILCRYLLFGNWWNLLEISHVMLHLWVNVTLANSYSCHCDPISPASVEQSFTMSSNLAFCPSCHRQSWSGHRVPTHCHAWTLHPQNHHI